MDGIPNYRTVRREADGEDLLGRGPKNQHERSLIVESRRDATKRLKSFGIPEELCVKYERLIGVAPHARPDYMQRIKITEAMIAAMEAGVRNVQLTSEDYTQIAEAVRFREAVRNRSADRLRHIREMEQSNNEVEQPKP